MNLRNKIIAFVAILNLYATSSTFAQESNTLYFMSGNPMQHIINPAYKPMGSFYIGFPALSSINLSAGNNDLVFTDIIQNVTVNGKKQTVTFLDRNSPNGVNNYLDALSDQTDLFAQTRIDLIDFGFRIHKSYITFGIANRSDVHCSIPKAFSTLLLDGMSEGETYDFDVDQLTLDANLYTEFALGYSQEINSKLTIGGKLKYLYGHGNIHSDFSDLKINASENRWAITGDGSVYAAIPGLKINEKEDGRIDSLYFDDNTDVKDFTTPSGQGAAIDLGATYKLLPQLKLSASILDLGFIRWGKNLNQVDKVSDFIYDGVQYNINDDTTKYWDKYEDMLKDMYKVNHNAKHYTTWLTTKVLVGGEYSFWKDRLGLGILSKTYIYDDDMLENLIASANFRPWKQLSATLTYGLCDGEWNNVGAGINLNMGPINLYCAVDNIPLKFAECDNVMIPSNTRNIRASLGMNMLFGYSSKHEKKRKEHEDVNVNEEPTITDSTANRKRKSRSKYQQATIKDTLNVDFSHDLDSIFADADGDGVTNRMDQCPGTPTGVKVDIYGCPVDEDQDGVADYLDKCPGTPLGSKVDANGCVDTTPEYEKVYDEIKQMPADTTPALKPINDLPADVKYLQQQAIYGIKYLQGGSIGIEKSSDELLDKVVECMKQHSGYKLNIKVYSDLQSNKQISKFITQEQSEMVSNYLIEHGVEANRITSEGMGADKQIASDKSKEGRRKNRRTILEFVQ